MLNNILEGVSTVAVGGHERPDGDCVGSCMAVYQYITDNFKNIETDVYLEEIPDSFLFLNGTEDIRHEIPAEKKYDLFICLDCGDQGRLGFSAPLFDKAERTFCVDHHISNVSFADENVIEPDASSTSELVYHLMDKEKISRETAEALYLGIVHDTGVFQHSCTAPSTFQMAAELLGKGVDAPALIRDTFYVKTYAQNQILGRALMESILFLDGRAIVSYLRKTTLDFYGVTPKELDGIVNHLRNTEGVKTAVFMYELEENVYKVSLRSDDDINVSEIASHFGGGGHQKAAGCTVKGTFHQIINKLSVEIEAQMERVS